MNNTKLKKNNALPTFNPTIIFLSFFGVGLIPYAPGTFGTIAAVPFILVANKLSLPVFLFIPIFIISVIITVFMTNMVQKKYKIHDPSWIVMDEVLGLFLVWIICHPKSYLGVTLAVIIFRFFDVLKPWPVSYFDKKIKNGYGVVFDDLAAAVLTSILLFSIKYFYPSI